MTQLLASNVFFSTLSAIVLIFSNGLVFVLTMFTDVILMLIRIFSIVIAILQGTAAVSTGVGNIFKLLNYNLWAGIVPIFIIVWWFNSLDQGAEKLAG